MVDRHERNWVFRVSAFGFTFPVVLHGAEEDVVNYANTEFPNWLGYIGVTDEDVKAYKHMGGKVYLV